MLPTSPSSSMERNTALAQAALDHALYFLEIGANDRAAAYYQFASQQIQGVVKDLLQPDLLQPDLTQPNLTQSGTIVPLRQHTSQTRRNASPPIRPFHN